MDFKTLCESGPSRLNVCRQIYFSWMFLNSVLISDWSFIGVWRNTFFGGGVPAPRLSSNPSCEWMWTNYATLIKNVFKETVNCSDENESRRCRALAGFVVRKSWSCVLYQSFIFVVKLSHEKSLTITKVFFFFCQTRAALSFQDDFIFNFF